LPWIVARYVPDVAVLKEAVVVHDSIMVMQEAALNDGSAKPPVVTAVKVITSVLSVGQPFSAVAVMTTVGGVAPFNAVTDELAAVIATQGAVPSELLKVPA
jgi:hypothetical protein